MFVDIVEYTVQVVPMNKEFQNEKIIMLVWHMVPQNTSKKLSYVKRH